MKRVVMNEEQRKKRFKVLRIKLRALADRFVLLAKDNGDNHATNHAEMEKLLSQIKKYLRELEHIQGDQSEAADLADTISQLLRARKQQVN
jgi:hypothetical protein